MSGIERIRALYADWERGDFSTTRGYLAPDVEWHQREVAIEPGVRRGHEGFGRIQRSIAEAFDDFRILPEEMAELGEQVLVVSLVRGRSKDTGVPLELRQVVLWTLRGDLVTRVQWFDTRAEAEAAAAA